MIKHTLKRDIKTTCCRSNIKFTANNDVIAIVRQSKKKYRLYKIKYVILK